MYNFFVLVLTLATGWAQAGNSQSAQPQGQRITINGAWQVLHTIRPTCAAPVYAETLPSYWSPLP